MYQPTEFQRHDTASQPQESQDRSAARQFLASLYYPKAPVFHAFDLADRGYLYDLSSGAVLSLTSEAATLLKAAEAGEVDGLEDSELDEAGEALEELQLIRELGFLALPDEESRPTVPQTTEALLDHSSKSTQILVQTSCNLKCSYCYEVKNGFHGTGKRMPADMGRAIVDFAFQRARKRGVVDINFFGGEPLLNFELVRELVDYAEKLGVEHRKHLSFRMTTNAVLMTPEIADFLVEKRFGVMVSLDGDPSKADSNRKDHSGRGTSRKALDGAKLLRDRQRVAGLREVTARATLFGENSDRQNVLDFLHGEGFRRVMVGSAGDLEADPAELPASEPDPVEGVEGKGLTALRAVLGMKDPEERMRHVHERGLSPTLNHVRERLQMADVAPSISCGVGRNTLAATEHGDLYPCHRYVGQKEYVVGSVEDGIDRPKLAAYYGTLLSGYESHCRKCWARILCGGQCAWERSGDSGDITGPSPKYCDGVRSSMEAMLALYTESQPSLLS